jgi:predicted HicB family RNase H-like nuclease
MTKNSNGRLRDGTPISDEMIEAMAEEAERGYDVDKLKVKSRGGRPRMGSEVASVESVRLDPELKRDLLLRASDEGVSLSELIRKALRKYVAAS